MSDQPTNPAPGPELKQSRSVGKSSGAKDAKSLKHNVNRTVEAADMPDLDKEREIIRRMGKRGHGAHNARTVERVLRYAEQGYSPATMYRSFKGIPHPDTIYRWRDEDPDFDEAYKTRYRHFVDDQTRQILPTVSAWRDDSKRLRSMLRQAKKLPKFDGMKPFEQMQAQDRLIQRTVDLTTSAVLVEEKLAHRTLQIAARQLPNDWGEKAEGESTTIVIDVGRSGPTKTLNLPGSADGQNVKALEAGRWKALPSPQDVGGAPANEKE